MRGFASRERAARKAGRSRGSTWRLEDKIPNSLVKERLQGLGSL